MVLSGVAAALGNGLASSLSGTDSISSWGNYAANARQIQADQEFRRKLAVIDYRIKHQQLHREDIRDLCELTVGRMDVYLIVGTLVLTFCIGWYTNNSITESGLPSWFINLFLLSNFTASAYLVFAVWLAMHASVAAHSVSVRLLTSAARLSIPTHEEIEAIQTSVMPTMAEFLTVGQKVMDAFKFSEQKPRKSKLADDKDDEQAASKQGFGTAADADDQDEDEEDKQSMKGMVEDDHFKRFLLEQRQWLGYDAYSRICMCFGMNQMLQALSYYILGMVWKVSPVSAMCSFAAVKMLGCLLLQLDVTGMDHSGRKRDSVALVLFYLVPPMLACLVLWAPMWNEWLPTEPRLLAVVALPVFILHAGWLVYLSAELYRGGADAHCLPPRLKTVAYLNVLQPEQKTLVADQKLQQLRTSMIWMQSARDDLSRRMQEAMLDEAKNKKLSNHARTRRDLAQAQKMLTETVAEARKAKEILGHTDPEIEREFRRSQRLLDRFSVWEQAPEICAVLKAFKDREVEGWLSDEQKRIVEVATRDFLQKCKDLGLGVQAVAEKDTSLPQVEREKRTVCIESYNDLFSTPSQVWISMGSGEVHEEAPPERVSFWHQSTYPRMSQPRLSQARLSLSRRSSARQSQVQQPPSSVVDFHSTFEVHLPQWSRCAESAGRPSVAGTVELQCLSPIEETESEEGTFVGSSVIPEVATPDERLPGMLVQKLTLGTAAVWVLCAFIHGTKGLVHTSGYWADVGPGKPSQVSLFKKSALQPLATTWPMPSSFLEAGALQCHRYGSDPDAHWVFVGAEFSTYVAQRFPNGDLGAFSELSEVSGGASAIFCNAGSCSALVPRSLGSPWVLYPIGNVPKHRPALVFMPSEWRGPVAAAWQSPDLRDVHGRLQRRRGKVARLAAWDGSGIVIADMVHKDRDGLEAAWSVKPRFRLFAEEASPLHGNETEDAALNATKYDDVRALQLSEDAKTLLVLQGNEILDAWDVGRGDLVARWYINGGESGFFTAMCYDGLELLFSRQLNDGLELRVVQTPAGLQPLFQPKVAESSLQTQIDVTEVEIDMQFWSRSLETMVQLSDHEVVSV